MTSGTDTHPDTAGRTGHGAVFGGSLVLGTLVLVGACLFMGAGHITLAGLFHDAEQQRLFVESRLPRTVSLMLAGASMSVAGMVMQMISRNRFVEPATSGMMQFAALGLILMALWFPGAPTGLVLVAASFSAFCGSMLFTVFVRRVRLANSLVVPLVGIMLGTVVGAVVTYIALQTDLMQMLTAWEAGSFTSIIRGRYELLWLGLAATAVIYLLARRFTLLNLGRDLAEGLGVRYRATILVGLVLVSAVTGQVVAVIGYLPFVGLVVPNCVSMVMGDEVRRNVPWVCLLGASLVLACDVIGRVIRAPSEIPVGTILGVVGTAGFLLLLMYRSRQS